MVLACSLLFGQTVWAAEPQKEENAEYVDENVAEESTAENTSEDVSDAAIQMEEQETPTSTESSNAEELTQKTVYIGIPQVVQGSSSTTPQDGWSVESSDPSVCTGEVKLIPYSGTGSRSKVFFFLEGQKPGNAVITVKENGTVCESYEVTTAEKPDDIVSFKDPMFGWELANMAQYTSEGRTIADADGDGYMSRSEMEALTTVSLNYGSSFTDISGLEYAANVMTVNFENQSELVNVDALYEMKNLSYITLTGTKVSTEDRFGLAKFRDLNLKKGLGGNPIANGKFFDEPLNVECIEGDEIVIYQEEQYTSNILLAIEAGDATVRLALDGYYADIHVHVEGIRSDQPIGEASNTDIMAMGGDRILGSNGTLWEFYPEVEKIRDDVDTYVAGWVYSGKDAMEYKYYTDQEGTLWSDNGELAKDSVQYTGHYSLDSEGLLTDIYNSQKTEVAGVKKWVEDRVSQGYDDETNMRLWKTTTYVLKNDGTLWSRLEVEKDQSVHSFEQFASDVKDINEDGYLTNTGEYYLWSDLEGTGNDQCGDNPGFCKPFVLYRAGRQCIYLYLSGLCKCRKR